MKKTILLLTSLAVSLLAGTTASAQTTITVNANQPVRTADEAVALGEKAKGDRILLRVWRGGEGRGGMLFLSVDNTKRK